MSFRGVKRVLHTSLSTLEPSLRTECGLSCTNAQCLEPMDHRGWGPLTWNKSITELEDLQYHYHNIMST